MIFTFPIQPKAVQSARFTKIGNFIKSYQPKSVHEYKGYIKVLTLSQLPPDFKMFEKEIKVSWTFKFPTLKSFSKKKLKAIEEGEIIYKITKPDLDNLIKATSDALTGTIWKDDCIISRQFSEKYYSFDSGIVLEVTEL